MLSRINIRHLLTDIFVSIATFYLSLFLRVNLDETHLFIADFNRILPFVILSRAIFFVYFETYNIIWRYVSAVDAFRLGKAIIGSSLVIVALTYLFQLGVIPRSIYFIDAFLLITILTGMRLSRRLFHEYKNSLVMKKFGEKTLIYGAGAAGQGVLKRLLVDKELKLSVIGFLDDDKLKIGKSILGFKVYGGMKDLAQVVGSFEVKRVVVGVPNPSTEFLKTLLSECAPLGIKPLLLILNSNQETKSELRELELKDLLVRPPHKIDILSTRDMIKGKRILVTGAGGSIGSEIVRQVLSFSPSRLIVLDHSEFNLYTLDQEIKSSENYKDIIVPALVDIRDTHCLKDIFDKHEPEIVFHAAAYKHVHLVEANPYSSVINNVEGTKNLLSLCEKFNVTNFVLVSSDKAVNPAGIMGATKRLCEILTSMSALNTGNVYCSVRFGNVLGSSGSLIPLLKKQIEAGDALTITHKDMTRYFMLIEEAVSLVLKAASISKPGDINVLRMGEPVKIVDIAENLIKLMGRSVLETEIKFTGLRPGEKMFEELYISGKELNTEHPDILVLPKGDALPENYSVTNFNIAIAEIIQCAKASDWQAIVKLGALINSQYFTSLRDGEAKMGLKL
ncbi:MAG: nucleoside-diphosphate sugar epimerase/dehydratase [Pseudobdellovibrio sp.]